MTDSPNGTDHPHGIGRPVLRKEDVRLLTGAGRYTGDARVPGAAEAVFVRSPYAHAKIRSIDVTKARAAPGVVAVLTGADYAADGLGPIPHVPNPAHITTPQKPAFENSDGSPVFHGEHWPLAPEKIRHVGEPVAMVIAETLDAAEEAAELVAVDYEILDAVTDVRRAVAEGAPQLWDGAARNVCFDADHGDRAAVEAAFSGAAHVIRLSLTNNRVTAVSMEARGAIGIWDAGSGRYTLIAGSQGSHRIRDPLASLLGVGPDHLRVVCEDVGGAYGMRNWLFPEYVAVIWAAQRCNRPVRWLSSRIESFQSDMQARDLATEAALALDEDGRFLALDIDHLGNIGAHTMSFVPMANGVRLVTSIYDIPAACVRARGVLTNTLPTGPYRGAGRPEAMFNIERLIDEAAAQTGIDRMELRRINLIPQDRLPFRNPLDVTYECGAFHDNMAALLSLADFKGLAASRDAADGRGRLRGFGLANYVETPVGYPRENIEIVIKPGGAVEVAVGTHSHGQGHETSFAQVVAEYLDLPFEDVTIIQGDTTRLPDGGGTHSNRSMRIAGELMVRGCETVLAAGRKRAADALEVAAEDLTYGAGSFTVAGTDRAIGLYGLAAEGPLNAAESFAGRIPAYPTGCAAAEVEIDVETGVVTVVGWTTIDDVGRAINPMIVEGQTHGGIAQGIGQALLEDLAYDDETGQPRGASFLDYAMPRAHDLPSFTTRLVENAPTKGNRLGVKGGGEGGTTPAPAALINAIVDALRPLGVTDIAMPATPLRVWQAIREASGS